MLRVFVAGLALSLTCAGAFARTYDLTLSGASPSGLWTLLGVGIDGAVKAAFPGSTITYQTSGGGFANIALVDQGKAPLGIAHDAELRIAVQGGKPFSKPVTGLRAIAVLYDWAPMQMLMSKSFADAHGIRSFEDIAKQKPPLRIALNKRGNITEYVAVKMLNAIGVQLADIEKWGGAVVYAASDEQGDLMKDKRIDMFANGVFVRTNFILQAGQSVPLALLPVSEPVVKRVSEELGVHPFLVKGGSYDWQPNDVATVALGAVLIANEKMDEQTAYDLARALHQHIDKLRAVHGSFKAMPVELLVSQHIIPFHKGAERYFREAGLIK
ncbi:MAG: TAXI family TRAP transporter solute-binding subunit [Burkholderiales bacterium]|nr:TAXI family TRAP transporter solute-binding subunit [Burkholderiales bacterium]